MNNGSFGVGGEGPDLKRLILAVVLMTGFLMVFNMFFLPTAVPEQVQEKPVAEKVESQPTPGAEKIAAPSALATSDQTPARIVDIEQGKYRARVSNVGGQIQAFELKDYEEPIQLAKPTHNELGLFALESRSPNVTLPFNAKYEVISSSNDAVRLKRTTPEGIEIERKYQFSKDQFGVKQSIQIKNGSGVSRNLAFNVLMGAKENTNKESSFFAPQHENIGVVCRGEERKRATSDKLREEPLKVTGDLRYVGLDERYFLVSLANLESGSAQGCTADAKLVDKEKNLEDVKLSMELAAFDLAPGASKTFSFESYLGPKQLGVLKAAGFGLDENIDFGWFGVISRPMLWLLVQINNFVGNFGIAIILLTFLIKLVTFPLTQKSYVSMQQMKTLAPLLKELQTKYSHDRTTLAQKQMELYKQKGINPMAGCLPMLIQMPVWFALYQMLWNSVELYQQPFWLWVKDLTQPDHFFVLPIAMGASMLVQTAFQPVPEEQPQMKYVMWGMPVFLTFIMLKMPAGLSLYILANNLLTIIQQFYIKRRYAA